MLVVEPLLVALGSGRVEDLLAEPLANRANIITNRLAIVFAGERGEQAGGQAYEAVPHVQYGLNLGLQHDLREACK